MGQKCNPIALRLKDREYDNQWFSLDKYAEYLEEDHNIRQFLNIKLSRSSVSKLILKRKTANTINVDIHTAKPGFVLGKGGESITRLKEETQNKFGKKFLLNVIEEKKPDKSAKLLSELVAIQLEKRIPFRRAMKMVVQNALKAGAEGIQVRCAGRLGGVEIARSEWYQEGRMPLHTIRAKIDHFLTEANTIYGKIGVQVWVNHGESTKETAETVHRRNER
jgi:small subunit ribosomal protein S3